MRIYLSPSNIKSFWVDRVFTYAAEAEEAVARVALEAGIIEMIQTEFFNEQVTPPHSFQPPTGPQSTRPYTPLNAAQSAPRLPSTSTNTRPVLNPRFPSRPLAQVPSSRIGNHTTPAPQFYKRGSTIYKRNFRPNNPRHGDYNPRSLLEEEDGEIFIAEEDTLDDSMEDNHSEGLSITSVGPEKFEGMMSSTPTCSPMSNKLVQLGGGSSTTAKKVTDEERKISPVEKRGMGLISRLARGWLGV